MATLFVFCNRLLLFSTALYYNTILVWNINTEIHNIIISVAYLIIYICLIIHNIYRSNNVPTWINEYLYILYYIKNRILKFLNEFNEDSLMNTVKLPLTDTSKKQTFLFCPSANLLLYKWVPYFFFFLHE